MRSRGSLGSDVDSVRLRHFALVGVHNGGVGSVCGFACELLLPVRRPNMVNGVASHRRT